MRWFRRLRGSDEWPDPPERLIDVPALRDPSPDLLRRLREIDPRAEVIYVGNGRWWVGRVKANSPRRAIGRRMALAIRNGDGHPWRIGDRDRWPELRQALLMAQGFGLVVDVTVQGEPDARLVREFAIAMHVEQGGSYRSPEAIREEEAKRKQERDRRDRERELLHWIYDRSPAGRGNPWVGYGGNPSIITRRIA